MGCLNGCLDLDYGEDESQAKVCKCTPEQVVQAIQRFNDRGIAVVFEPR